MSGVAVVRSRPSRLPRSIAVALSIALTAAPTSPLFAKPTPADDATKAEARARIERGKALYAEGAFEAALVEFQRAYELAPSYKILYNIGLIEQQLNDFVASLRAYERYLKEGGKEVAASRKSEVEKSIASLKQSIATVTVKVNVEGADVSIDDVSVGKSPLADGVLVNAGKRRVAATKDGRSATKVVSVAGGDTTTVSLDIAASPPPLTASKSTTTAADLVEPETPTTKTKVPWIGVAVTGALAAGTIVTGILALKASSTLKSDRDTLGASRSVLDDDQSRVKRWSIASDVLLGATLVAGGITAYFWLKKPDDSGKTGAATVNVGFTPGALVVAGSF